MSSYSTIPTGPDPKTQELKALAYFLADVLQTAYPDFAATSNDFQIRRETFTVSQVNHAGKIDRPIDQYRIIFSERVPRTFRPVIELLLSNEGIHPRTDVGAMPSIIPISSWGKPPPEPTLEQKCSFLISPSEIDAVTKIIRNSEFQQRISTLLKHSADITTQASKIINQLLTKQAPIESGDLFIVDIDKLYVWVDAVVAPTTGVAIKTALWSLTHLPRPSEQLGSREFHDKLLTELSAVDLIWRFTPLRVSVHSIHATMEGLSEVYYVLNSRKSGEQKVTISKDQIEIELFVAEGRNRITDVFFRPLCNHLPNGLKALLYDIDGKYSFRLEITGQDAAKRFYDTTFNPSFRCEMMARQIELLLEANLDLPKGKVVIKNDESGPVFTLLDVPNASEIARDLCQAFRVTTNFEVECKDNSLAFKSPTILEVLTQIEDQLLSGGKIWREVAMVTALQIQKCLRSALLEASKVAAPIENCRPDRAPSYSAFNIDLSEAGHRVIKGLLELLREELMLSDKQAWDHWPGMGTFQSYGVHIARAVTKTEPSSPTLLADLYQLVVVNYPSFLSKLKQRYKS